MTLNNEPQMTVLQGYTLLGEPIERISVDTPRGKLNFESIFGWEIPEKVNIKSTLLGFPLVSSFLLLKLKREIREIEEPRKDLVLALDRLRCDFEDSFESYSQGNEKAFSKDNQRGQISDYLDYLGMETFKQFILNPEIPTKINSLEKELYSNQYTLVVGNRVNPSWIEPSLLDKIRQYSLKREKIQWIKKDIQDETPQSPLILKGLITSLIIAGGLSIYYTYLPKIGELSNFSNGGYQCAVSKELEFDLTKPDNLKLISLGIGIYAVGGLTGFTSNLFLNQPTYTLKSIRINCEKIDPKTEGPDSVFIKPKLPKDLSFQNSPEGIKKMSEKLTSIINNAPIILNKK